MEEITDLTLEELAQDPYPAFDRIRQAGSAVHVPATRLHLVTRFADIMHVERHAGDFASTNPGSLMNHIMGHSLMRKDFADHKAERRAIEPTFAAATVEAHWVPRLTALAEELVEGVRSRGEADLFDAFAAPMAARALIDLLGFEPDVAWQDMCAWSQAMMDAVGNYAGDADIAAKGHAAAAAIAREIDRALPRHRATPGPSVLASMAHSDPPQTMDRMRANVNVIVGGGLNEPRDSILTLTQALLQHPGQLAQVQADPRLWSAAFEESVRWVAPIGMYPRRVTRDITLGDSALREGDQLGICVGAANRDPARFDRPHAFDLTRKRRQHLGFGAGPHFCAGTWVARQMVGQIAVPRLFARLKGLRLDPARPPRMRGWVFRGPVTLPVQWDA